MEHGLFFDRINMLGNQLAVNQCRERPLIITAHLADSATARLDATTVMA
jgi:hypothetical protein